jgi:anaerobic dimethyl sulfoxide reductase subunit A
MGECKSDLEIAAELAERLGIEDFAPCAEKEYLETFLEKTPDLSREIHDPERFRQEGLHRIRLSEPIVAFREQIEDPENHPFPTPSGKIEIFSQRVADMKDRACPAIPKHMAVSEDRNDRLAQKYPLQLLSPHAVNRVHSDLHKIDWLVEVEPHRAWINPVDATPRGIEDRDLIYVFNARGKLAIHAFVTERITPGVISIQEGAWYDPDHEGIDRGGCVNVLTSDAISGGGAAALKTALVQVEKKKKRL